MIMKAILGLSHGHGISEAVENGKEDLEVKNEGEKGNKDSLTVTKSQDARKLKNLGVQIAIALAIQIINLYNRNCCSSNWNNICNSIALSLHKIPEGLIISLPIYYVTGSRWKAFVIAASIGVISQMLGATLG